MRDTLKSAASPNRDERLELARERALLILRIAREEWRSPEERLGQIAHEAEHFYFIATGYRA